MARVRTLLRRIPWLRPLGILLSIVLMGLITLKLSATAESHSVIHPLDPLTAEEIEATAEVIREAHPFSEKTAFAIIDLHEPDKAEVIGFKPGDPVTRQSFAVVYDREANLTYEAVVDLKSQELVSWEEVSGVQPNMLDAEYGLAEEIVKADPAWQAAMQKRGIDNFDQVAVDCWAPGNLSEEEVASGDRFCRGIPYYKGDHWNYYGAPIEGVLATVNLTQEKVSTLIDDDRIVAFSKQNFDYDMETLGSVRTGPKPLQFSQPEGASFKIDGNQITWQDWTLRFGMHPREGLVIYTASFNDKGEARPVLYRASLSEMVVPYGDPESTWNFRNAFDVGEYNFGLLANTMELGKEVPDNALLLDAVFADNDGDPYTMPGVIGVYEKDNGILWKHYEYGSGRNDVRRSRQLVLTMTSAIGNYDYGISWIFDQDGTLEVQADLTGIVLAQGTDATTVAEQETYAPLLAEHVGGVNHQHYFSFRMDMDVDGTANQVSELNVMPLPKGPDNPAGNAFTAQENLLDSEQDAVRDMNMMSNRKWRIGSSQANSPIGDHPSYVLMPGHNAMFLPVEGANIRDRSGFATHHFWVTHYQPDELYAGGKYPNQSQPGEGLPAWISDDEPLQNEDLVVWYSLGVTHVPRPEDWPVMSVHRAGFKMVPWGFFARNPAIDLEDPVG